MKNSRLLLLFILTLFLIFCKKERNKNATVLRNCTGTYLRMDGKDYRVCNIELVSQFTDGTKVSVTYNKIEAFNGSAIDQSVCKMLYPSEGWIEVEKIR